MSWTDNSNSIYGERTYRLNRYWPLTNKINGKSSENETYKKQGRLTIEEIQSTYSRQDVQVLPEHSGFSFILNKLYKFGMTDLQLFEATRGVA